MPWRGPEFPGEFPTLGWIVGEWIEQMCVIPDRAAAGQPFKLTKWQWNHLLWQFRLHPDAVADDDRPAAPFPFNGTLLVYPQKMGKGPFSASRSLAQAVGPVLFAGWDADGDPVGKPWPSAHVQIAATAEDQTKNIWRAIKPMVELGPLADVITDTGVERMNLPSGGIIETVTSKALTRLGARITYVEIDQPESMNDHNGGTKLAQTLLRNLGGTGGRFAATGNAHDPTEGSIQQTWVDRPRRDMHIDFPKSPNGSWKNKRDRRRIITTVYKDSPWVDPDRILDECDAFDLAGDPNQAERFYGNRVVAGSATAFDKEHFEKLTRAATGIARGRKVTLGFDGATTFDTTGLVATDIETGHSVVVGLWARPLDIRDDAYWHVPIEELNAAVKWAFEESGWNVWRMYCDPPHYRSDIARWAGQYGAERVIEWWTQNDKAMARAIKEFVADMGKSAPGTGPLTHGPLDESEEAAEHHKALIDHVGNAVRKLTKIRDDEEDATAPFLWLIRKESQKSVRKIDLAMCLILAWLARNDAIRAGVLNQQHGIRGW